MVALRVDEDLRLALQAPERLGMDDAIAVALERRPDGTGLLLPLPALRLVGAHRERRQRPLLVLANALLEHVGDPARDLHPARVVAGPGGGVGG